MLTNSGLSEANEANLLSAFRSHQSRWQVAGSEGTHRSVRQVRRSTLRVHFTASEIRIPMRFNIDYSNASSDFELPSSKVEDWVDVIDEVWNGRFRLRGGQHTFPLVFLPYMARDLTSPDVNLLVYEGTGRCNVRHTTPKTLTLYMQGFGSGLDRRTVAHEFGHLVGNPDEYDLTQASYQSVTQQTTPVVRGGRTVESVMGSQYESTAVRERHAFGVLQIVNAARDQTRFPAPFTILT